DVTAWHSRGGVWPSSNWLTDIRPAPRGTGGRTLIDWITEHPQFERAKIGVAGLDGSYLIHVRAVEGGLNWQSLDMLKREFPQANFVSATPVLGPARWRKSAEEIEFLRKGTEIAEKTMQAVVEYARAGASEREVFAEMLFANADADGSFTPMIGWVSGPLGNPYHRLEQPTFRKLAAGDILALEIEGRYGGYVAQIDQTFSVGPAPADLKEGFKLACDSFDRAHEALRPGITVGELADAADLSGLGGRAKARLTMHGRGTGDDGPPWYGVPPAEVRDIVIEEGCCLILKPGASVDGKPEYGRWGDSVAVRPNGAERLGTRPQQLYELL
ncbi:MAG TPA: M24 family metallopeptidase, partial [Chloroflexota bacterium]